MKSQKTRLEPSTLLLLSEGLMDSRTQKGEEERGTTRALFRVAAYSRGHLERGLGLKKKKKIVNTTFTCLARLLPDINSLFTGLFSGAWTLWESPDAYDVTMPWSTSEGMSQRRRPLSSHIQGALYAWWGGTGDLMPNIWLPLNSANMEFKLCLLSQS